MESHYHRLQPREEDSSNKSFISFGHGDDGKTIKTIIDSILCLNDFEESARFFCKQKKQIPDGNSDAYLNYFFYDNQMRLVKGGNFPTIVGCDFDTESDYESFGLKSPIDNVMDIPFVQFKDISKLNRFLKLKGSDLKNYLHNNLDSGNNNSIKFIAYKGNCLPEVDIVPTSYIAFVGRSKKNPTTKLLNRHYNAYFSTILDAKNYEGNDDDPELDERLALCNLNKKSLLRKYGLTSSNLNLEQTLIQLFFITEINEFSKLNNLNLGLDPSYFDNDNNHIKLDKVLKSYLDRDYLDKSRNAYSNLFIDPPKLINKIMHSIFNFKRLRENDRNGKSIEKSIEFNKKKDLKKVEALIDLGLPITLIKKYFPNQDYSGLILNNILEEYLTGNNAHLMIAYLVDKVFDNKMFNYGQYKLEHAFNLVRSFIYRKSAQMSKGTPLLIDKINKGLENIFFKSIPYLLFCGYNPKQILSTTKNLDLDISQKQLREYIHSLGSQIFEMGSYDPKKIKQWSKHAFYNRNIIQIPCDESLWDSAFNNQKFSPLGNKFKSNYEKFEKTKSSLIFSDGKIMQKYSLTKINVPLFTFFLGFNKNLIFQIGNMRERYNPRILYALGKLDVSKVGDKDFENLYLKKREKIRNLVKSSNHFFGWKSYDIGLIPYVSKLDSLAEYELNICDWPFRLSNLDNLSKLKGTKGLGQRFKEFRERHGKSDLESKIKNLQENSDLILDNKEDEYRNTIDGVSDEQKELNDHVLRQLFKEKFIDLPFIIHYRNLLMRIFTVLTYPNLSEKEYKKLFKDRHQMISIYYNYLIKMIDPGKMVSMISVRRDFEDYQPISKQEMRMNRVLSTV